MAPDRAGDAAWHRAYEVMQALNTKRRLPVPGMSGNVPIIAICARTNAGRALAVAVRKIGGLDQEIVGARDLTPDELAPV